MNNGKVEERCKVEEREQLRATMQQQAAEAAARPGRKLRVVLLMLFLLAGSTAVSFVVFRYVAPRIPRELVGTWRVVEGDMKGATLEFHWNGSGSAAMFNKQGKREVAESSVRVRGKRIFMTYKAPGPGQEDTVIQTIVKLTDDELVIRDQDQVTYHMIRID